MYLVDSNVFLELELDQTRADVCGSFLERVRRGELEAVITDFQVDTVVIVMENYGKGPEDRETFLSSLVGYDGLKIYFLSLVDRVVATRQMERLGLDFDDALAYQAMRRLNLTDVVSYDKHFDLVPGIKRVEPSKIRKESNSRSL